MTLPGPVGTASRPLLHALITSEDVQIFSTIYRTMWIFPPHKITSNVFYKCLFKTLVYTISQDVRMANFMTRI